MSITKSIYVKKLVTASVLTFTLVTLPLQAYASDATSNQGKTAVPLNEQSAAEFLDEFFSNASPYYTGAAVTIVKDGKVISEKGYGYANVEEKTAVDAKDTVFRIASVSKTFTAVAIMQLAEQGKLQLQDDISKYLPNVEIQNPFKQPVTIEHLLTHESGFEVRDPNNEDLHTDYEKYVSIDDYVQKNMPPVVRQPGTSYMYDNFAYLLLGLIVQNASGVPYEEYINDHIFDTLGMDQSGFVFEDIEFDQLVTGYDAAGQVIEPYVYMPTIMPHGGMLSTADDIGKFMISYLNEGKAENEALLSEKSVKEMSKYQSFAHDLLPNTTYGFEAPSQLSLAGSSSKVITKLGDLPGNSSMLMLIPDEETGVFLSYNTNGILRELFYIEFINKFYPSYASPAALDKFEAYSIEQLTKLEGYYTDLRVKSIVSAIKAVEEGKLLITDALIGPRTLHQVDHNLFVDELTQKFTGFYTNSETGKVYMKEPYLNPLGYAIKGEEAKGFKDIEEANVYAPYIHALQSLAFYSNEENQLFNPTQAVTRAEFVEHILTISALKGSTTTQYAFNDITDHPKASFIQAGFELGMIKGDGKGNFNPDRAVTRQEAAVMIGNIYQMMYPMELFSSIELAGQTDEWAIPAVQLMIALGYFGPETTVSENGSLDFKSKASLNRQEEAAILYQLLFQPADSIIASMNAQNAEASVQ